jgi:hypothetical protein
MLAPGNFPHDAARRILSTHTCFRDYEAQRTRRCRLKLEHSPKSYSTLSLDPARFRPAIQDGLSWEAPDDFGDVVKVRLGRKDVLWIEKLDAVLVVVNFSAHD